MAKNIHVFKDPFSKNIVNTILQLSIIRIIGVNYRSVARAFSVFLHDLYSRHARQFKAELWEN